MILLRRLSNKGTYTGALLNNAKTHFEMSFLKSLFRPQVTRRILQCRVTFEMSEGFLVSENEDRKPGLPQNSAE